MSNSFYNVTSNPAYNSSLDSSLIRSEYAAIATGFDKSTNIESTVEPSGRFV